MSGSEDERFEKADAGSSLREKIDSNRLKPGFLVITKDFSCRISDVTTAKPQERTDLLRLFARVKIFLQEKIMSAHSTPVI